MESFVNEVIPENILNKKKIDIGEEKDEESTLKELRKIALQNKVFKSFIGEGHYNTITPKVILRNVFENPSWYTSYTPYQPEISQGRLEALINFQTMISDLTAMDIANASLLDEATAAAEAMTLAKRSSKSKSNTFFVDNNCFKNTINVLKTRALPLGIKIKIGSIQEANSCDYFGILLQYPGSDGELRNFEKIVSYAQKQNALTVFASDLLALTLLKAPGEFNADIVIGSSQRFGVPLGCGGPHAAFMAVNENLKRSLPGRIVGASIDSSGELAYRLALQTREQHIRREKATSNICTAQALLAIMAGFYAVYHGPEGLKQIAKSVNDLTNLLAQNLKENGFQLLNESFFDTLTISTRHKTKEIIDRALSAECNLRIIDENSVGISLDETSSMEDVKNLLLIFLNKDIKISQSDNNSIPKDLIRKTDFLKHSVFSDYQTETEMLRYIKKLGDKVGYHNDGIVKWGHDTSRFLYYEIKCNL